MDPFDKLPAELRIQILISLGCYIPTKAIRLASPAMFQQYQESWVQLAQAFLPQLLPGQLLQDALAIVTFPDHTFPGHDSHDACPISRHLRLREEGRLSNPLSTRDTATTAKVIKLYTMLTMYIEDYISKATSPRSSEEYHELPFPRNPDRHAVRFENLQWLERERLLRAFLGYELLCQSYRRGRHPPNFPATSNFAVAYAARKASLHDPGCPGYVGPGRSLVSEIWSWHAFTAYHLPWKIEALRCVHEYVCSLYGAMFARCAHAATSRFGDRPPPAKVDALFSHTGYALRLHQSLGCSNDTRLAPVYFAALGFGLVTRLLASDPETRAEQFCRLGRVAAKTICWEEPDPRVYIHSGFHDSSWGLNPRRRGSDKSVPARDAVPALAELLRWRIYRPGSPRPVYPGPNWYRDARKLRDAQVTLYRQRAWAFFDDARLFPTVSSHRDGSSSDHFATVEDLLKLDKGLLDLFDLEGPLRQTRVIRARERREPPA